MRALNCVFVSPAYFSSCQALMQLHPHICRGLPPPIGMGLSRGPGAPDSRLINHGAWVMTPHCSPNVFWREPLPLALSSRRHTYGRSEWVTGPLLRVWHPARRKPSAPHIDTRADNHTHAPQARRRVTGEREEIGKKCRLANLLTSKWTVKNKASRAMWYFSKQLGMRSIWSPVTQGCATFRVECRMSFWVPLQFMNLNCIEMM